MKNYVISLASAIDRREHITKEFGKYSIEFEFFDAVIPKQVDILACEYNIDISNTYLSKGELACLFSHICLWKKLLESNEQVICIYEDDVILSENISKFYDTMTSKIGNKLIELDLIKLETFGIPLKLGKQLPLVKNLCLYEMLTCHYGGAGYMLKSTGAHLLLDHISQISQTKLPPVDHILFESFLSVGKVYQLTPAVCIQKQLIDSNTKLISSLETGRISARKQKTGIRKRSLPKKIIAEITNPLRKLYKKIYYDRVDFK